MNQILKPDIESADDNYVSSVTNSKKFTLYKFIFFICLSCTIVFSYFFVKFLINIKTKEKHAESLANQFTLSSLYSNSTDYTTNLNQSNTVEDTGEADPFVIGVIKIDKIKIDYPILSSTSDELLTVAPCRFAGPMPNEVGNLCIAGHNYIDNTFFAKITNLEKDDEISIFDLNGQMVNYYVTEKFEIENNDFSCTTQETNGEKWLTLMTCNSIKGTRIIVRAIAKE